MAEHTSTTPSGISILFEDGEPNSVTGKSKKRAYTVNGEKLPSVTTILGILDKPGLPWAAEKLTAAGAVELAREGALPLHPAGVLSAMGARNLRFRQVWDGKADRGKLSHEDLVHLAAGRELPPLSDYPREQRGFISGVAAFMADYRPTIHESETMVASLEHGYSGRPDLVVTLGVDRLLDGEPAPRGRGLLDLKTHEKLPRTKPSQTHPRGQIKTPYPENLLQLGLYEIARRESGYEPTDWQAVVSVDVEGTVDFTVSWLEPERALDMLPAYRTFKACASRVKSAADTRPVGLAA